MGTPEVIWLLKQGDGEFVWSDDPDPDPVPYNPDEKIAYVRADAIADFVEKFVDAVRQGTVQEFLDALTIQKVQEDAHDHM